MRRTAPVLAMLLFTACIKEIPEPDFTPIPVADAGIVDQVVFLVGDAGEALFDTTPLMPHLQNEVERWSAALDREESVSVLFLGDNVYPSGIHDLGDPRRALDSLHLDAQVQIMNGPNAVRWRNRGFFVAGNHDWGNLYGLEGLQRIRNQERMLDAYGNRPRVDLYPEAGLPGPQVVDAGEAVRFVFLDTHWWLQAGHDHILRDTVFFNVREILSGAGDRALVFVSHHPFASGGTHGGPVPFWRGMGLLWLLNKTGSLVQDLNSPIYRELQGGLEALFRDIRQPLIYAGGHDHSLQVVEDIGPEKPQWSLVAGSASKTGDVGPAPGLRFGVDKPGYMRLAFRRDGAVELHVYATTNEYLHCGDDEGEDVATCMSAGVNAFEEVFSSQLREPHPIETVTGDHGQP